MDDRGAGEVAPIDAVVDLAGAGREAPVPSVAPSVVET
jgi:hypothetical protein